MSADTLVRKHGRARLEERWPLANKAKLTVAELQAYEKARDELRQVHEISNARWAEGLVSDDTRVRIKAYKDAASLDRWVVRAATAVSAEALFSEQG